MGTRNLTVVKYNDNIKVAQYGQFDGYPDGQGEKVVRFLLKSGNVEKLKANLDKVRFLDEDGVDKEYIEDYNERAPTWSNDPDTRTTEQKEWWRTFMTRDLGAEILENITNSEMEEILLDDSFDFGNESLLCEWAYVVDLDTELLYVYKGFQEKPHNKGMWSNGDPYEAKSSGTTYYPIKPIAKMNINPTTLEKSWDNFLTSYRDADE